jgi:hypothetical protein
LGSFLGPSLGPVLLPESASSACAAAGGNKVTSACKVEQLSKMGANDDK